MADVINKGPYKLTEADPAELSKFLESNLAPVSEAKGINNQELYELIKDKKTVALDFPELKDNKDALVLLGKNILNNLNVIKSHDKKLYEAFDGFDNFVIKVEFHGETGLKFFGSPPPKKTSYTNFQILD